jgi:hypothetical protein
VFFIRTVVLDDCFFDKIANNAGRTSFGTSFLDSVLHFRFFDSGLGFGFEPDQKLFGIWSDSLLGGGDLVLTE